MTKVWQNCQRLYICGLLSGQAASGSEAVLVLVWRNPFEMTHFYSNSVTNQEIFQFVGIENLSYQVKWKIQPVKRAGLKILPKKVFAG